MSTSFTANDPCLKLVFDKTEDNSLDSYTLSVQTLEDFIQFPVSGWGWHVSHQLVYSADTDTHKTDRMWKLRSENSLEVARWIAQWMEGEETTEALVESIRQRLVWFLHVVQSFNPEL